MYSNLTARVMTCSSLMGKNGRHRFMVQGPKIILMHHGVFLVDNIFNN